MEQILLRPKTKVLPRQLPREKTVSKAQESVVKETHTATKRLRVELENVQTVVDKIRKDFRHNRLLNQKLHNMVIEKKTQLSELAKQVNDHGANLGMLAAHVDIDEEKFASFKLRYEHLQQDIEASLDMTALNEMLTHAMAIVEQLVSEASALDALHCTMSTVLNELNCEVKEVDECNLQHKADILSLMHQHDELKVKIQIAVEESAKINEEEQELTKQLEQLSSDVAASATECSSLSTEYNSAIETYQRHREAVIVLKQQYDTNAKAHADQSDYFRDTERELLRQQTDHESSLERVHQQFSALHLQYCNEENKNSDIEANVLAAESVLENLETRYKLMQEEHNEHLNTFALQKEEQQQADGTLLSIKQEVIEAEQGIERGLECMKGTALELFDLKAEEFQLQHTLNKLKQQADAKIQEAQCELAEIQKKNLELEAKVAQSAEEAAVAEKDLAIAKEKSSQLVQMCIDNDLALIKDEEDLSRILLSSKAHRDTLKDLSEELERVTNATLAESDMSIENLEITITEKNKAIAMMEVEVRQVQEETAAMEQQLSQQYVPSEEDWLAIEELTAQQIAKCITQNNFDKERRKMHDQIRQLRRNPAEVFPSIIVQREKELGKLKSELDDLRQQHQAEQETKDAVGLSASSNMDARCTLHTRSRTRARQTVTVPHVESIKRTKDVANETTERARAATSPSTESSEALLFKELKNATTCGHAGQYDDVREEKHHSVEDDLDITPLLHECALPTVSSHEVVKTYGKKRAVCSSRHMHKHHDIRLKNDMRSGKHALKSRTVRKVLQSKKPVAPSSTQPNNFSQQGDWFNDESDYFVFGGN